LALGKLNFSCAVIGLTFINRTCRQRTGTLNLGVPVVNFPRANAILAPRTGIALGTGLTDARNYCTSHKTLSNSIPLFV
jgi:hypothetical protein